MLVRISETLLAEGRARVAKADGAREALAALVEWHIEFALDHRALIVVHNRDWSSLPDEARERVRALQRAYVDVWATEVRRFDGDLSPEASRTRAHVLFGLLNSTPHSGRLPDPQMHDVLRDMAHGALGLG
nr:TetR/AcrR family transcriptional regulator [Nocardioides sp. zg-1308]